MHSMDLHHALYATVDAGIVEGLSALATQFVTLQESRTR
jgi:hypothetical protein